MVIVEEFTASQDILYGGIPQFFDVLFGRVHGVQGVAVIDIGKIHFSIILAEVAGIVQISGGVPHGLRGLSGIRSPTMANAPMMITNRRKGIRINKAFLSFISNPSLCKMKCKVFVISNIIPWFLLANKGKVR